MLILMLMIITIIVMRIIRIKYINVSNDDGNMVNGTADSR